MRHLGVLAVALSSLAIATPAQAAKVGVAPTSPGIVDLMALRGHAFALVQVRRGRRVPGAELVSRRLGIWRLRTARAQHVALGLRPLAIEPDRELVPQRAIADPFAELEWWRGAVGADQVTPPGPGKRVTVVDTGLDVSHPEFAGRANTTLLNAQSTTGADDEAHGTAVSSLIAAPENGVGLVGIYPQAQLAEWDSGPMFVSDVIQGIDRALDAGPSVINMSFGFDGYDRLLADEVDVAFGAGSLLVAAAGNDFLEGNAVHSPASLPHVLTVAATDEQNKASSFSNRSPAVDLAAPGENIPVAVPTWLDASGYSAGDGTSFSAPLVSGAAAWVWTRRPELDVTQLFDLMRWSAKDIDVPGFDEETGWGLLDVPSALTHSAPSVDPDEPNDDVNQIVPGRLFRSADPPLTAPRRGSASVTARLDVTEDPEDVYRVWVPAQRRVAIRVTVSADADVELWNATTPSVLVTGAGRRKHLLAGSGYVGTHPEAVSFRNRTRRGTYVYLDVYLPQRGASTAQYVATISTTR
jgi:subtilisin family serine protease